MDPHEQEVLERIEAKRRRPHVKLIDEHITLAHGAGGKASHALIEALLVRELGNEILAPLGDSAVFSAGASDGPPIAFTTDTYVVNPLFFPGGNIGELAVNGTVNDLAMSGARPLYLSCGLILEEGFPTAELQRIIAAMAAAAEAADVRIATGDTKVVERGKGDGLYINTAGVGVLERRRVLTPSEVRAGDRVLVSGPIGEHGMAIMIARGDLELEVDLHSDTAALHGIVAALLDSVQGVRCLRDPTRGGVATVLNEIALGCELAVVLEEAAVPIRPEVSGACEILGLDPLYVASEGRFVAVVAADEAEAALSALRDHPLGTEAAIVGEVRQEPPGMVLLDTAFGGSRVVDMLTGDPLPRIC